ncbi:MAG: spermidine/putrescine ABC transporter substrate-binding protein [Legionellaceae bacterium]|nr:spermidine/putrescine ABC transporter substrate-binding protein [Legionellaceae bacterium]
MLAAKQVNVYVWGGEIPKSIVQQFERETGINVNFSSYDSNETLYAKLKAGQKGTYDVILPSAYFVERMRKQQMLEKLDWRYLSNKKNIAATFSNHDYDPENQYSVPLIWGLTGIFSSHPSPALRGWHNFWDKKYRGQLMLLDDAREVFSMALLSLGYSPNDQQSEHIEEAYIKLKQLIPNIKLLASEGIQAIMIDQDVQTGMAWNGDVFKALKENQELHFIFPDDGFVIWVDCLAIPKNPPHPQAAYQFINFLLRADIARQITLLEGHAITNQAGRDSLPADIRNNPLLYPDERILAKGHFQRDVSDEVLQLYGKYWQALKLSF